MVLLLLAEATTAHAQRVSVRRWYRVPVVYGRRVVAPWGWWGRWYGGATTPYGDYARGMAAVLRARGLAAENYTRAQINYQEARSRYIDNQKKWLETYYARKQMGEAARQERFDRIRAERQRYSAWQAEHSEPRLTLSDLEPVTGKLDWPAALQSAEFADLRRELNRLFELRAQTDSTPRISQQIYDKARAMQGLLKEKIRDIPTDQYIAARKFLDRMAHEARHVARG